MRLDEMTVAVLLSYIQTPPGGPYSDDSRLIAATLLKNKIKLVYGVSPHHTTNPLCSNTRTPTTTRRRPMPLTP
jgi:hypothetical protein